MKEAGLRRNESIEAVEPALHGPGALVPSRTGVMFLGVVPLADGHRGIAVVPQQLRQGRRIGGKLSAVTRITGIAVSNPSAPDRVRILSGEQRRASRRAHRHGGVVAEPQSAGCQLVDVRRIDLGAEYAEIGIAQIVQQYDDDIRRTRRCAT